MEPKNDFIGYKKNILHEGKEAIVTTELNLPDYYPDICKILCCRVTPCVENKQRQNDYLTVEGNACVRLLYASEEKALHCFEVYVRYTKDAKYTDASENDIFTVEQKCENVHYRAIGPRRVDVKATIAVIFSVCRLCTLPTYDNLSETVEFLHTEKDILCTETAECVSMVLNEDFTPKDERLRKAKIIHEELRMDCRETKTVTDKVLIKGSIELMMLCLQENSNVLFKCAQSIPFSHVAEVHGLQEDAVCFVHCDIGKYNIAVSESGACNITVCADCFVESRLEKNIFLIHDLYAVDRETDVQYERSEVCTAQRQFAETISCSVPFDIKPSDKEFIYTAFCSDLKYAGSFADGVLKISGVAEVVIVAAAENDYLYFSKTVPLAYTRDCAEIRNCEPVFEIHCKTISYNKTTDGLTVNADFSCSGYLQLKEKTEYVSSYEQHEETAAPAFDRVSVYFAESGENVWSIAKENKASYRLVKELNDVDADVLSASRPLLLVSR